MANIEDYLNNEMTLSAVSEEMVKASEQRKRFYLGMSEIGEPCWRMLWYRFRDCSKESLSVNSILAIEDGYKQEDIMAARLRMVKGIKLATVDPTTKQQFSYKLFGGHVGGHPDGIISGILEAPKTVHVWENKAVNEKKFKQLQNLISDVGEKHALEKWDEVYYAQAQMYMEMEKTTRHYLTVQTPGGRRYTACRTEYNVKAVISLKEKAKTIITAERPPSRMSENRSYFKCGWCKMKEICFDSKAPTVGCRTCAFSEPDLDDNTGLATWNCIRKGKPFAGEGTACPEHLYLNTLVPFPTIDADKSKGAPDWIKYGLESGECFYNVNSKAKKIPSSTCLTSNEIFEKEYFELCFSPENVENELLKDIVSDKKITKKLKGVI